MRWWRIVADGRPKNRQAKFIIKSYCKIVLLGINSANESRTFAGIYRVSGINCVFLVNFLIRFKQEPIFDGRRCLWKGIAVIFYLYLLFFISCDQAQSSNTKKLYR